MRKVVKHFAAEKEKTRAWRKILEQTTATLLRQSADESLESASGKSAKARSEPQGRVVLPGQR